MKRLRNGYHELRNLLPLQQNNLLLVLGWQIQWELASFTFKLLRSGPRAYSE